MDLISLNYDTDSASLLAGSSSGSVTAASNYMSGSSGLSTGKLTTGGSDESSVSAGGSLLQQLGNLQSSDPDKFKEVAQNISGKLREAAKGSDTATASSLSDLAARFSSAASTGSMSALVGTSSGSASLQGYSRSGGTSSALESASGIISQALSGTESASA